MTAATFGEVRPKLKELDFRRQLVATGPQPGLVVVYGWEHVGFRAAMTARGWRTPGTGSMAKGWPDLTLIRQRHGLRRLIFAELKSDTGRLDADQERVLAVLRCLEGEWASADGQRLRVDVCVWRPRDIEAIAELLA
jgi:hypothetical protein